MSELVITIAVGGLLVILAIVLLSGRGSFLIAGFNTMSKDEKAKYDARELCKFIGKILLPIGILVSFVGIESITSWYVWVCVPAILGISIFAIVYINVGSRFRK